MRYAVYISTAAEPNVLVFSGSYPNKEDALKKLEWIHKVSAWQKGAIIEVSHPDQKIDPMAKDLWDMKPSKQSEKV